MKGHLALPPSLNTPIPTGLGCCYPQVCCNGLRAEDREALNLRLAWPTVTCCGPWRRNCRRLQDAELRSHPPGMDTAFQAPKERGPSAASANVWKKYARQRQGDQKESLTSPLLPLARLVCELSTIVMNNGARTS